MKHLSENWEAIDFPLITARGDRWANRNFTLSSLKSMLTQDNLKLYEDYVIQTNTEVREQRCVTIRFKEEGQGLIYLIKWVGSRFYNDHA